MKQLILHIALNFSFTLLLNAQTNPNHVHVNGHYNNGNYVNGYMRTAPNSTNRDNFSTSPNINPYTGKTGTITPDNYNNNSYNFDAELDAAYKRHGLDKADLDNKFENSMKGYISPEMKLKIEYSFYPRYYCKGIANLRRGPSKNSDIILTMEELDYVRVINTNTVYDIYGNASTYWKVFHVTSTRIGYVYKSLLVKEND